MERLVRSSSMFSSSFCKMLCRKGCVARYAATLATAFEVAVTHSWHSPCSSWVSPLQLWIDVLVFSSFVPRFKNAQEKLSSLSRVQSLDPDWWNMATSLVTAANYHVTTLSCDVNQVDFSIFSLSVTSQGFGVVSFFLYSNKVMRRPLLSLVPELLRLNADVASICADLTLFAAIIQLSKCLHWIGR